MKKWKLIRTVLLGTLAAAAVSVYALAAAGSEGDPLITLSYLTQQFTPSVLSQVDGQIEQAKAGLAAQLDEKIQNSGGGGAVSAGYTVVSMSQGQRLVGTAGCEILLRSGSASCTAAANPGLIDLTGGAELDAGLPVTANHLYMATDGSGGIVAGSDVTVLVRGSYTVQ